MKVASYFTLKNCNITLFKLWLNTLPVRLRGGQIESLWNNTKGKKAVLWTQKGGFSFF